MNREIKFRAWHKELNDMTYSLKNEVDFWYKVTNYPEMYFIMQYTGLKDKNGKDIYEGDIISVCNGSINGTLWMDKHYEVKYKMCGFDICLFCWDKEGNNNMDSTHWCEVIGNVYENNDRIKPFKN